MIGLPLYAAVSELMPQEWLAGDLAFSHLVSGDDSSTTGGTGTAALTFVPLPLQERLAWLREKAAELLRSLASEVAAEKYDLVGFSLMFQIAPALAAARFVRQYSADARVVVGGSHCEGEMGHAIHRLFDSVDFVCRGEGERVAVELAQRLEEGATDFSGIDGLVWRDSGATVCNGHQAAARPELNDLPIPTYHGWVAELEASSVRSKVAQLWIPLETSRGCWFGEKSQCLYCGLAGGSRGYRRKSAERVVEELEGITLYGIDKVLCVDLTLPREHFSDLIPELEKRRLPLSLFFEVRSGLRREQLVALRNAGINMLQPGIESLSSELLRLMRKGILAHHNVRFLKWAAELGLSTEWNILYGIPGETPGEYSKMASMIPLLTHLRPPSVGCLRVRVDRFSPLFEELKANGHALRPVSAYEAVFRLDERNLGELAYHFEVEGPGSTPLYVRELERAVRRWQNSVGTESLCHFTTEDGCLRVFDRRSCRIVERGELSGAEKVVYRSCSGGATLDEIHGATGVAKQSVQRVLDGFLGRRWMLALDGRYLSLSVDMSAVLDGYRPPNSILESVCHAVHCERMRSLWSPRGWESLL